MDNEDHDLLIKIESNLDNLVSNFFTYCKTVDTRFKDHNGRIRLLERAIWVGFGVVIVLQIVVPLWINGGG